MRISVCAAALVAVAVAVAGCSGGTGVVSGSPAGAPGSSAGGANTASTATTPGAPTVSNTAATGSAGAAPSGQVWYTSRDGRTHQKLAIPPVTHVVSAYPDALALTASGEVWTIGPSNASAVRLDLSGVRQLSTHQDTGNPDPWYALRANGTVAVGTGDAAHPFNDVTLPFTDITEIAASDGLWVLRSDGTVWYMTIDFETVSDSGKPVSTGYAGDTYGVPRGVKSAPVQGLADVTHLWNGAHTQPPIAETKDGRLVALDRSGANDQPAALALAAPGAPVVQMCDADATWVALDAKGQLWYWPAGTDHNSDSSRYKMLAEGPPQRLVGPTASGRIIVDDGMVYSADGTVWQFESSDSGSVSVHQVTDSSTGKPMLLSYPGHQRLLATTGGRGRATLTVVG